MCVCIVPLSVEFFGLEQTVTSVTCVPVCSLKGESTPSAYFYQNLAEAEYVCATYQYMRLLGYPAHTVTVLTTYNGQRHLLQDVFQLK